MANPIQIKRTSVSGRAANTSTLTNPGELAINMTDGIMYSTNGSVVFEVGANLSSLAISGTPAINSSGYWVGPSLYAQQEDYIYSITTSTSVITGADDNSDVLSYTAGLESVFINGVRQIAGVDYATTNATAITLTDPVINNDVVQVINFEGSIEATNVDAQFAWTNTHTFSNTVTINDKLGIGTASPAFKLDVQTSTGDALARFKDTDSLHDGIRIGGDTNGGFIGNASGFTSEAIYFQNSANALRFFTNASEALRIDSSGNVGIGTTVAGSYGRNIHLHDPSTTSASVKLSHTGTGTGATDGLELIMSGLNGFLQNREAGFLSFGTSNAERMRIDSSGNVGIGTSSPLGLLEVANITEAASEDTQVWFTTRGTGSGSDVILNLVCENTTTGETFINFGDSAATDAGQLRYNHDGDIMQFRTATSERMRIDSSGYMGIGTTSSAIRLQVTDVDQATARIGVQNLNGQNYQFVAGNPGASNAGLAIYDATSAATRMYIDSSGNVGIGLTSPSTKLHVNGDIRAENGRFLATRGTAAAPAYRFHDDGDTGMFNLATDILGFATGGSERMRITSSGNVGIGTSSPSFALQVETSANANAGVFIRNSNTDASASGTLTVASGVGNIFMRAHSAANSVWPSSTMLSSDSGFTGGLNIVQAGANPIRLWTNGSERMRITSTGSVGIGTTNPSFYSGKLTVAGGNIAIEGGNRALFWNTGGTGVASIQGVGTNELSFSTSNSYTERMRINSSGNVGIGTSSPVARLHVSGGATDPLRVDTDTGLAAIFRGRTGDNSAQLRFLDSAGNLSAIMGLIGTDLRFYTDGASERMRITSAGSVGIGTTSPGAKLDVNGSVRFVDSTSAGPDLEFGNFGGSTKINNVANARNYYGAYEHIFTNFDNSTERMRIDSSGNVGIGTSSPAALLHVQNASDAASRVVITHISGGNSYGGYIQSLGAGANQGLAFGRRFNSNETEAMRITSSGSVGIGTTSPAEKLEIANAGSVNLKLNNTSAGIDLTIGAQASAARITAGSGDKLGLGAGGTADGLVLDATNNVGIGTSSPAVKLEAAGTTRITNATVANSAIFQVTADATGSNGVNLESTYYGAGGFGPLKFTTSNTERMRIDSSGRVGIGTTAPSGLLDVQDNTGSLSSTLDITAEFNRNDGVYNPRLQIRHSTSGTDLHHTYSSGASNFTFSNGGTERMRIDSGGNVLVGTTSGSSKFNLAYTYSQTGATWVSSSTSAHTAIEFTNPNGTVGTINTSGSATAYNTSSDYRLKDIDGPVANSGAYIDALKPVQGSWKADGSRFIGLLAHEVQEVSETQIATGEKDGEEMQAMDYSSPELIANLIAEIQSLRARVAQLEGNT